MAATQSAAFETGNTETAGALITVKQIPVIEEALRTVSEAIEKKTAYAASLACTEETVKDIKKLRAELTKEFNELEAKRKSVKNAVMSPYEAFEKVYRQFVTDKYGKADNILKKKINEVESGVKQLKEDEVRRWFAEYAQSKNIEWLTYERAGINVTLSASEKSLKEQAQKFIDRAADDISAIMMQYSGYREDEVNEILVEYRCSLSVCEAIKAVRDRRRAIREQKEKAAADEARADAEQKAAEKVEQFAPPTEIEAPAPDEPKPKEKIYSVKFEVKGTMAQLKSLKQFLTEGEYEYVSIK